MFLTNDFLLITYPVKPLHGMTAEKYMDVQTKVVLNAKGPVSETYKLELYQEIHTPEK